MTTASDIDLLTDDEAQLLTSLVSAGSEKTLLQKALVTIGNKAAFTSNQDILRKAGCLQRLSALLKSYKLAVTIGHQVDPDCLQCALNAVNNLAMNVNNQSLLAECIPTLASFVSLHTGNAVQLAALEALTNLSVTSAYQSHFMPVVGSVVDIAAGSTNVKLILQSLRLLANLTFSSEFVDHVLKYKDPSCLLDILDKCSDPDVVLRVLTCLVNIHSVVAKNTRESPSEPQMTVTSPAQSELPAAAAVCTVNCFDGEYLQRLHEKLTRLREHSDSRVQDAALRLIHLC